MLSHLQVAVHKDPLDRVDMDRLPEAVEHHQLGMAAVHTVAAVVQQDMLEEDTVLQLDTAVDTLVSLAPCWPA